MVIGGIAPSSKVGSEPGLITTILEPAWVLPGAFQGSGHGLAAVDPRGFHCCRGVGTDPTLVFAPEFLHLPVNNFGTIQTCVGVILEPQSVAEIDLSLVTYTIDRGGLSPALS